MKITISVWAGEQHKGSKIVQTPCFIGRGKDVGLTISHPSVSRKHCELYEEAGQLYLRDNSSLNGTLLRGEFVETPVPIQPGDEFVIGELQLRIEPATSVDADTEVRPSVDVEPISGNNADDELGLAPEK